MHHYIQCKETTFINGMKNNLHNTIKWLLTISQGLKTLDIVKTLDLFLISNTGSFLDI